jgi:hypothetical protein
MKTRGFVLFTVFALTFLFSSITASAQQPRAVPPNDNFLGAKTIQIGKSYPVPDIGAATNEGGEPTASCTGGIAVLNSVWFTFTQPTTSTLSLSTFGSNLFTVQGYNMDTVLAVYELTGPATFTERACSDDSNGVAAAQIVFLAGAGKTYYIAAGTFSNSDFLPTSTLKLTTRILSTLILPLNPDFETPIGGPGWTVKNGDTNQIVCSDPAYPAYLGSCAFRFTGTPGVTTKLVQTIPFPSTFAPRKNALLSIQFYFRVLDTVTISNTKARFTVIYTDGTPPTHGIIDLGGTAASANYSSRVTAIPLKSSKVGSIKLQTKFGASSGVLLVDALFLTYQASIATRGGSLLPVPGAPAAQ